MKQDGFTRATVVSVRNGRVVLKEEDGKYITIIHEPNPNIILTVDDSTSLAIPEKTP